MIQFKDSSSIIVSMSGESISIDEIVNYLQSTLFPTTHIQVSLIPIFSEAIFTSLSSILPSTSAITTTHQNDEHEVKKNKNGSDISHIIHNLLG